MRHSALTTVAVSFFCLIGVDIAAAAQWPASVVGVWDVFANTSHLTLRIGSQGASGACPKIAGTINNIGVQETLSKASTAQTADGSAFSERMHLRMTPSKRGPAMHRFLARYP